MGPQSASVSLNSTDVEQLKLLHPEVAQQMQDDKDEWLGRMNYFRWRHGVPNFEWNEHVAWAAWKCVTDHGYQHCDSYNDAPPNGPAGENIAEGYASIEDASWGWYNEINDCPSLPGCESSSTGHFTAMVWKGATQLGCYKSSDNIYNCHFKGDDQIDCTTPNCAGCYEDNVPAPVHVEVPRSASVSLNSTDIEQLKLLHPEVAQQMKDDQDEWLQRMNYFRWKHGVPDFEWNEHVAWAAWKCVTDHGYQHCDSYNDAPPNGPAGENIAEGYASIEDASWGWYNEINDCPSLPGCQSGSTGHFTAMV